MEINTINNRFNLLDHLGGQEGQYHPIAHITIEYKLKMLIAVISPIYIVGIAILINPVKTFAWFPHIVGEEQIPLRSRLLREKVVTYDQEDCQSMLVYCIK